MIFDKIKQAEETGSDGLQQKAKRLAMDHFNSGLQNLHGGSKLHKDDFYVVWFSKTLQNWKALVSTDVANGIYYEITYNGDRLEAYVDVYKKLDNVTVSDIDGQINTNIWPVYDN